jgi:single-stranded-DNA-specific exonuclease
LKYRWTQYNADTTVVSQIAQTLSLPHSIAKILNTRGIHDAYTAQSFFKPDLKQLHSPLLMDGMETAVQRILRAIEQKELIRVYGDYDVDGTVSTAMLLHFLQAIGANAEFYVSDRFTEGYGISAEAIRDAHKDGVHLFISVDTGVTAVEPIRLAQSLGIDCIICDHHEPGNALPPALAILDPIKGSCAYPYKHLCGCGVTFKLIQGVCNTLGKPELAYDYLDYAAIATSSDMVPLTGENRVLVHFGLDKLNDKPRPGIAGLLVCTNTQIGTITSATIAFNLAPRINAAGRLGDASRAVELMLSENELHAFRLAQELESNNYQRRSIDEKTFREAREMAEELITKHHYRSLVLHNPDWHVGVINIVASRLVERFHLPTIMLTSLDGVAKGSARSIKNFDIHTALKLCSEHLKQFGGHKYASGLSVEEVNIPALRSAFDTIARTMLTEDMVLPELLLDSEIAFSDISSHFLHLLRQFAPYGYHNPKPQFVTHHIFTAGRPVIVGKNHLKLRLRHGTTIVDAIGFNLGDLLDLCAPNTPLSIVYTIEETTQPRGRAMMQLYIKDIRPTEEAQHQIVEKSLMADIVKTDTEAPTDETILVIPSDDIPSSLSVS